MRNPVIREVSATTWLSTTGGDEEMNGRSRRSPAPKTAKPSSGLGILGMSLPHRVLPGRL